MYTCLIVAACQLKYTVKHMVDSLGKYRYTIDIVMGRRGGGATSVHTVESSSSRPLLSGHLHCPDSPNWSCGL